MKKSQCVRYNMHNVLHQVCVDVLITLIHTEQDASTCARISIHLINNMQLTGADNAQTEHADVDVCIITCSVYQSVQMSPRSTEEGHGVTECDKTPGSDCERSLYLHVLNGS